MKRMNQLSVLLVCGFCVVTGDIMVYVQETHRQVLDEFRDLSSTFGGQIPQIGIRAFLVYASPPNACTPIKPPPTNVTNFTGHWAVLIKRYDCPFEKKVRMAQAANYDIAIVHNVNSSELMRMQATNPEGINIPSVFVSSLSGSILQENYQYDKGYYIVVDYDSPFDIGTHLLLPFAVVVAICFSIMIVFTVLKCIKDRRRARRHRLPNSSLKRIPTTKYKKDSPYETCAICLDDFVEGEKLRLLPCSHAYHCKCIDPWLTKSKRVCPMCKRRVFAEDERVPTDSESESDDNDNTPLLRGNRNNNQGGGTFVNTDTEAHRRFFVDRIRRRFALEGFTGRRLTQSESGEAAGPSQSGEDPSNPAEDPYSATNPFSSSSGGSVSSVSDEFPPFIIDFSPPPPGGAHSIQETAEDETVQPSLTEDC